MRTSSRAVLATLTASALLCDATPALGLKGAPGGAQAPSSQKTGGIEYGVSSGVQARPTITALSVPSTATAGRPPKVTLRLDEKGVGTVYLQLAVTSLTTHRPAVLANMGWSHTGRTLLVNWPRAARLAPGSYQVSVSAHDHHGATLLRRAHSSGEATLTIKAAPKPVAPVPARAPAPAPVPAPAVPEPGVPTPAQTAAAGAVFPVAGAHSFGNSVNRFGAPRSGHIHQGQDVLTAEGTPVLAPLSGVIESRSLQAGAAGYYVVEHTGVGFDLFFAHCQAGTFAVSAGQGVSPGQALCLAGQSGDATAPHLHFEMWVGGWQAAAGHPIDPLPYLEAWDRTGASG
ncbi:MAG: M23 family metallopeptidase [Solirubrobacterales bacterium]|nr:M23 family metallopeptidase [Solirubrobacterales bacterium]